MMANEYLTQSIAQLAEITVAKEKHLEAILEITRQQEKILSEGMSEQLAAQIDDKQKHIDAINELDEKFDRIYAGMDEKPHALRVALQHSVMRVQGLAEDIHALEQQNNVKVNEAIEEVKQRLKGINKGKRGYNAYKRESHSADGIYIDENK